MEKNCGTKSRKKKNISDNVNYVEEEEFVDFHTFQEMWFLHIFRNGGLCKQRTILEYLSSLKKEPKRRIASFWIWFTYIDDILIVFRLLSSKNGG